LLASFPKMDEMLGEMRESHKESGQQLQQIINLMLSQQGVAAGPAQPAAAQPGQPGPSSGSV
jgi:hypothetical protein